MVSRILFGNQIIQKHAKTKYFTKNYKKYAIQNSLNYLMSRSQVHQGQEGKVIYNTHILLAQRILIGRKALLLYHLGGMGNYSTLFLVLELFKNLKNV